MLQIICIALIICIMMRIEKSIRKRCSIDQQRIIQWSIFIAYCVGNLYFTLLSRDFNASGDLECMPFSTYWRLFEEPELAADSTSTFASRFLHGILPIEGIILNILLYFPLGYLLSILFPKLKPKHIILIGCLCSIATEATQYIFKLGWCETDDVIHNTLGTAIGVWAWRLQSKRLYKSTQ